MRDTSRASARRSEDTRKKMEEVADEAAKGTEATKAALSAMDGGRVQRMFTRGAKALLASTAIMLMFLTGFMSWSAATAARKQASSDGEGDQPAQVASSSRQPSVSGMPRTGRRILDSVSRFTGFMTAPSGISGRRIFGGRMTAAERQSVDADRKSLEESWQKRADERAEQRKADQTSITEQLRKEATEKEPSGDSEKSGNDAASEDGSATESKVTDQQIQGVIETSRNASGR